MNVFLLRMVHSVTHMPVNITTRNKTQTSILLKEDMSLAEKLQMAIVSGITFASISEEVAFMPSNR